MSAVHSVQPQYSTRRFALRWRSRDLSPILNYLVTHWASRGGRYEGSLEASRWTEDHHRVLTDIGLEFDCDHRKAWVAFIQRQPRGGAPRQLSIRSFVFGSALPGILRFKNLPLAEQNGYVLLELRAFEILRRALSLRYEGRIALWRSPSGHACAGNTPVQCTLNPATTGQATLEVRHDVACAICEEAAHDVLEEVARLCLKELPS